MEEEVEEEVVAEVSLNFVSFIEFVANSGATKVI